MAQCGKRIGGEENIEKGWRQEEWMMNREHREAIKSPVDSSMTACS